MLIPLLLGMMLTNSIQGLTCRHCVGPMVGNTNSSMQKAFQVPSTTDTNCGESPASVGTTQTCEAGDWCMTAFTDTHEQQIVEFVIRGCLQQVYTADQLAKAGGIGAIEKGCLIGETVAESGVSKTKAWLCYCNNADNCNSDSMTSIKNGSIISNLSCVFYFAIVCWFLITV